MVAYCLSCNIINTFSVSSNTVCCTVRIDLPVGSLRHLTGRVGIVRAARRSGPRKEVLPNIMLLSVLQKCVPALSSWNTSPFTLFRVQMVFLPGPASGLTAAVWTLFRSWNLAFGILSCPLLSTMFGAISDYFSFFFHLTLIIDCVVNWLYRNNFQSGLPPQYVSLDSKHASSRPLAGLKFSIIITNR